MIAKTSGSLKHGLGMGLLLCATLSASANTIVTFNVDMSVAATNGTFFSTNTVAARGSFNGWAAFALTNNPSGVNTNLWSGTTNLPSGAGTVMSYKYTIEPGATYETVVEAGGHNRLITLPSASGASITLPQVYFSDTPPAQSNVDVTFQVDMAQQINTGAFDTNTSSVYTRGFFNGFAQGGPMTNDPSILRTNQNGLVTSNVYTFTFTITGSPGETTDWKYYIDTGSNWESPAANTGDPADNNNRFFNLASSATQKLPIVFFNDAVYAPIATNATTFQVDMSAQIANGNFDPSTMSVEVRGNFNSWGGTPIVCTNDPAALNTNLYKAVVSLTDGVGANEYYKFWGAQNNGNGGWETMADNRALTIVSGTAQTLPRVYFSNVSPNDQLPEDTLITISVNMTNAVGNDSHTFDPVNDSVYVNGLFGFVGWNTTALAAYQLTNNPVGSELYSLQVLMPKGTPVQLTYKFGINGNDDEAATGQNHVRFIRKVGSYVLPLDTFANQHVEPSFGNLAIGSAAAGHAGVSWLGRPGVHLQTRSSLLPDSSWLDHFETDGTNWSNGASSPDGFVSATNYPAGGSETFFRLIKPF